MKNILIIAGGGKKHLEAFNKEAKNVGVNIKIASFSDLYFDTINDSKKIVLKTENTDLKSFDCIYLRLVGKRFEDVSILVDYAKKYKIKIIDRIYKDSKYIRLPLAKGLESKLLTEKGIAHPKTIFSSLLNISQKAPLAFGFPFVIKGTTGKQGHAVWSPNTKEELKLLLEELLPRENKGEKFIAQEFIKSSTRIRVLVIGGKAKAAIVRPTRWRKRFDKKEPVRNSYINVPKNLAKISEKACKALSIDIAGVDILEDDQTKKLYILEVNSAPRWNSIKNDTGLNVEREILKFLKK